jgi:hypothetical protein
LQDESSVEASKARFLQQFSVREDEFARVWPVWKTNFLSSGFLVKR